jgi:hypothetical protein
LRFSGGLRPSRKKEEIKKKRLSLSRIKYGVVPDTFPSLEGRGCKGRVK